MIRTLLPRKPLVGRILLGLGGLFGPFAPFPVSADTARYQVTFQATWNGVDQPTDFPANAHFSGLIGGTHAASVNFWQPGQAASVGIERMAEMGSKSALQEEVQAAINAGTADGVLSGGNIAQSPGQVALTFDIRDNFPLVTLVSMVAPSPDWFVGVHDLNLRAGGNWLGRTTIDLIPYDAGTDDGITFTSADVEPAVHGTIQPITGFPFAGTPPLGTFTFLRLIDGDLNETGTLDAGDIDRLSAALRAGSQDLALDVNHDQQVNGQDRAVWIHQLAGTSAGDANLDGRFDTMDLVQVFQAGGYEDAVAGNSGWSQGDWDGNGDFDASDLVLSFQEGSYQGGGMSSQVATVPEPASWVLSCLSLGGLVAHRRRSTRPLA